MNVTANFVLCSDIQKPRKYGKIAYTSHSRHYFSVYVGDLSVSLWDRDGAVYYMYSVPSGLGNNSAFRNNSRLITFLRNVGSTHLRDSLIEIRGLCLD